MTRSSIELYNVYKTGSSIRCRKGAVLYVPFNGEPQSGALFDRLLSKARVELKRSGSKYWWNALRVAKYLVEQDTTKKLSIYPCSDISPSAVHIWRVYLLDTAGGYELTCHSVSFERGVMNRLIHLDWQQVSAKYKNT